MRVLKVTGPTKDEGTETVTDPFFEKALRAYGRWVAEFYEEIRAVRMD